MKYIKVIGTIIKEMDMVKISILMDLIMKVNGQMTYKTDLAGNWTSKEQYMREIFKTDTYFYIYKSIATRLRYTDTSGWL